MLHLVHINTDNAVLGRKVSDLRRGRGWSQSYLAQTLGDALERTMDATAITRMEGGRRPFLVHELIALARIFEVDPADFLVESNPIDNAIRFARLREDELASRWKRVHRDHLEAVKFASRLDHLRAYQTSSDPADLAQGIAFMLTIPELFRTRDWREILLDAGVKDDDIKKAQQQSRVTDPFADTDGYMALKFVQRLRKVLGLPEEADA